MPLTVTEQEPWRDRIARRIDREDRELQGRRSGPGQPRQAGGAGDRARRSSLKEPAHLYGVLILAGIIAAVAGSWPLFWLLVAVLTVSAIHSGDIRLSPRRRR